MTSLLPTATTTTGALPLTGWIALAVLGWLGWRLVLIALFPWAACPRCHGAARLRSPNGKNWRPCPRCKGAGRRLRLGRRVWNWTHDRT